MKTIYLLIGIPGSGKSHWLKNKVTETNCILDDASQLDNPLILLKNAVNDENIKKIYISDVNFLDLNTLKKAESLIKDYMAHQDYKIKYIAFKSTKEISAHNVLLRNDKRDVGGTIKRFHRNYPEILEYLSSKDTETIEAKAYIKNHTNPF